VTGGVERPSSASMRSPAPLMAVVLHRSLPLTAVAASE